MCVCKLDLVVRIQYRSKDMFALVTCNNYVAFVIMIIIEHLFKSIFQIKLKFTLLYMK